MNQNGLIIEGLGDNHSPGSLLYGHETSPYDKWQMLTAETST